MTRILLMSGDILEGGETLRRKVLRFTGSRRSTRAILKRLDAARQMGRVMSCMVLPRSIEAHDVDRGDDIGWDVRVSFVNARGRGGAHA